MSLQLPEGPGQDREDAILDYVAQGRFQAEFAPVVSTYKGHTATFQVYADALRIEGVRVNVTAVTEQKIADMTGCSLLTAKLADLRWAQRAAKLNPFPREITASTASMIEHSQKIDQALAKLGNVTGVVSTVGKHWIIDNLLADKPGRAMNYGWHFEGASFQGISGEPCASLMKQPNGTYYRLIQGRGTAHDPHHVDYSQICVLVSRSCVVDGVERTLAEVLTSPELAPLASHQGVLTVLRQPGVEEVAGPLVLPEVVVTATC